MAGFIVWIVVLVFILSSVKKGQKKGRTGVPNQPNIPPKKTQNPASSSSNQEELKRRLQNKYAGTKQQPDILAKASANVAEDFEEKRVSQPSKKMEESKLAYQPSERKGQTESQIVQQADALAKVDMNKIFENPKVLQESEVMKTVSDLMAKGVDTELPFQRDFVAEGLDMINSMTL